MPSQIRMPRCVGCRGSSRKQRLFYARLVSTRAICRANVPLTTQRKRWGSCLFYSICYEITNEALVFGGDVMTATDITVHLGMVEFGDTQKLLIGNFPNFIIFSSFVLFFNCTSKSSLPLVHLTHKSPAFTIFCNVSPLQTPNVALSKRSLDFAKSRLLFLLQR